MVEMVQHFHAGPRDVGTEVVQRITYLYQVEIATLGNFTAVTALLFAFENRSCDVQVNGRV